MVNVLPIDLRLLPVYALLLQIRIDLIGIEVKFGQLLPDAHLSN